MLLLPSQVSYRVKSLKGGNRGLYRGLLKGLLKGGY